MRMHMFHRAALSLSRVMATAAATAAAAATLTVGIVVAPQPALAAEPTPAGPDNAAAGSAKIGVLSDTHYYPANYADDDDDFHDYVGGDPKLLEESNAISDKAVDMIIKDHPDYVLVTGDLTKDGEQQAEIDIANKFRRSKTKPRKPVTTTARARRSSSSTATTTSTTLTRGTSTKAPSSANLPRS